MSNDSEEVVDILADIRKWIKFSQLSEGRDRVHSAIQDADKEKERENKIIYHLTNGENSASTISEYISVSHDTVNTRQSAWAEKGLLEKKGSNSPYDKFITLEEVGYSVPDIPEAEPE